MIRAVLFDAVGTLIHPQPSVPRAYHAAGSRHGSRLDEAEIGRRFAAAFARREEADRRAGDFRTSELGERQRWRMIVAEVFDDAPDSEPIFAALWEHFAAPRHWPLFDDVATLLSWLGERNLTWGVASNFDARLAAIARESPVLADCPRLYVSSQLGVRKPHVDFFRAIERDLQLEGEQLLLVGDDLDNDYRAALAAGWRAVLLDRGGAAPAGVATITGLAELTTGAEWRDLLAP